MYTECAHCHSVFRVRAGHLRAAAGRVRCGACGTEFDAIAGLRDERYVARALGAHAADEAEHDGVEPSAVSDGPPDGALVPAGTPGPGVHPSARPTLADQVVAPVPDGGSAEPAALLTMPEALREDLVRLDRERGALARRGAAFAASLVLVAALLAQLAWFHTEAVWRMYPQARGALESFCGATGCRLPSRRDPAAMRVVSREVRVHPRYEGALELMAVIANGAPYPQPLPGVQFTLFNVNGQVIATRVFSPAEYLGAVAGLPGPIPPDRPLQIALEMVAPEEAAVSYELRFF